MSKHSKKEKDDQKELEKIRAKYPWYEPGEDYLPEPDETWLDLLELRAERERLKKGVRDER